MPKQHFPLALAPLLALTCLQGGHGLLYCHYFMEAFVHILIHDLQKAACWQSALQDAFPDAQVDTTDEVGSVPAEILIVWQPPTALLAAQDQRLQAILNLGAGVDALLNSAALPDVPVFKLRGAGMEPFMTEYVRYGLLHFYRNMDHYHRDQRKGVWQPRGLEDRQDWPVCVLGLGTIGRYVAQAIAADGFPVHGWSRHEKHLDHVTTHAGEQALAPLLSKSRVVINLLPDTPLTRGYLNHQLLGCLPKGAVVINIGRGTTLVLEDLMARLDEGHLRGAVLDVFPEEPLNADHPIRGYDNVLITPHISGPTPIKGAIDQLVSYLQAIARKDFSEAVSREAGY
ncbi:2-hydroxyacid dehydrogenase [Larsenimonas rhizosphaerae]|uniref:Glyoxylate/hydroxypyruvate reductase A n=1 Tax=Larsenimonas rhizosphaerae TaxID=2944682 RepID=A0AA41ZCA0_9GAMM|nr:glyoxylate/hydroxypyruvate reductase A [Larsenimonas rhizosphaerae]MCX2522677.1 glyoxylate/hydroxypyruvate reductase A [Larsenimonas rhizosphaerae]